MPPSRHARETDRIPCRRIKFIVRHRILPHLGDEAIALARHGTNEALLLAAVADDLTYRAYAAAESRLRNDTPAPHGRDEVVIGDDTITVANEVFQNVENLRRHREGSFRCSPL